MTSATQQRCDDMQSHLVAFVSGELEGLEKHRIEAHLRHCDACGHVRDELDSGLVEARSFEPDVPRAHLEHLNLRLQPYLPEKRRSFRLPVAALGLGAAMAAAVVVFVTTPAPAPQTESEPSIAFATPTVAAPVTTQQPSRYVRLIASHDWDGHIEGEANDMSITMSKGFAVFSFEGGRKRRLRVSAPDALIEVVGTRFYVESDEGSTKVGVAEGRVRVLTLEGTRYLSAGDSMAVGAEATGDGSDARARRFLDAPSLLEHHAATARTKAKAKARKRVTGEGTDILAQLSQAEELVTLGEFRAAIDSYRTIAADPRPELAAYRDHSRYEIARIWAFHLGEIRRAQSILRPLAKRARGEVGRQATLALCELTLKARPCMSASCLDALIEGADVQLAMEAKRLHAHWGLQALACE